MRNKYQALLYSLSAVVIPVILFFEVLMHIGLIPLLTDSISFDAKIIYTKQKNIAQVNLLAIGSSITLNNLSSQVVKDSLTTSYFNFSAWGLQIGDIRQVIIKYLPRYKPKYILICSSLPDFKADNSPSILNYLNKPQFIKDHFEEYFYIGNYNSVKDIKERQTEYHKLKVLTGDYPSLNFDSYGGVLLNIPKSRISAERWNEHDSFPTNFTDKQYQELASLCLFLKTNNVRLIFVQAPIKNAYLNTSRSKKIAAGHFTKCKTIVTTYNGTYLNFVDPKIFSNDQLFVDQFHLSQAGATLFTKQLAHSLKGVKGLD